MREGQGMTNPEEQAARAIIEARCDHGELNEAKEEVRRQVEMRLLDQGRHHVDLQEASSQLEAARSQEEQP